MLNAFDAHDGCLASAAGDDLLARIGRALWLDRSERRFLGAARRRRRGNRVPDSLEAGEALNGERHKNDAAGFAAAFRRSGQ